MENTQVIEKVKKISDLNIKSQNDKKNILYPYENFVEAFMEISDETVKFIYNIENLHRMEDIKKCRKTDKFRFLLNVSRLEKYNKDFIFSIDENNLYYDYNFIPKIAERDLRSKTNVVDEHEWLHKYKSMIGYVLTDSYSYNNFYKGGESLLIKNSYTEKYYKIKSKEELEKQLRDDLEQAKKELTTKYVVANKKALKRNKTAFRSFITLSIIFFAYFVYSFVFILPDYKNTIKAGDYFINKEYSQVVESLQDIKIKKMDKAVKYQLAYASLASESLSENQKNVILETLGKNSDENILDYWIYIGRKDYDTAINTAKKLSDNELLMYGLLKKKFAIQSDENLDGDVKEAEISKLDSQIDKLNEILNPPEDEKTEQTEEKNKEQTAEDTKTETNQKEISNSNNMPALQSNTTQENKNSETENGTDSLQNGQVQNQGN